MIKKTNLAVTISLFLTLFLLSACNYQVIRNKVNEQNGIQKKDKNITKEPVQNKQEANLSVADQLAQQSQIKKFSDLEELQEFLENSEVDGRNSYSSFGSMRGDVMMESMNDSVNFGLPMQKMEMESKALTNTSQSGGSDDFSKTNVQVEGVDEADIIKTDGKYIYAVVKNDLYIIDAYPVDSSKVLTKISFKDRPQDIYINDDSLVIFGYDTQIYKNETFNHFRRRNSFSFFKVFDISDPKEPKQVRDLNFEGNYRDSRMIGDYVYFVTNNYNYHYIEDEPVLPRVIDGGQVVNQTCVSEESSKCFVPDVYYFDIPYSSYNFTVVNAINIKDSEEQVKGDVYIMSSSQNMFVSQNNIFLTYTKYINEYDLMMEVMLELVFPNLSKKNQDKITKINSVDSFILNKNEKRQKVAALVERYIQSLSDVEQENLENKTENAMKKKYEDIAKELEKTVIHKISINKGDLEYKTNGEVTGHILNQFSMDESDGYFRIATTKNQTWSRYMADDSERESYNNLYVLDENLKQVGAVEGLARGERIYSVRFMQNRAYMVTFKQTDPLFVIDLSVPEEPKVLGELKIPGFSNYLHPYDDNFLIGIGKDTKETEWSGVRTKGLKLSLFDVRDVENPKEVDVYVMGDYGSDSIALHDHKAFLFSKEKHLLSIPVSIRESIGENRWGDLTFSGAAVFEVTEAGFELKAKIDHSNGGKSSERDYFRGYNYYDNTVKRSLYIDKVLYTFSNNYIKMNEMGEYDLLKNLQLKKNRSGVDDDFEIVN